MNIRALTRSFSRYTLLVHLLLFTKSLIDRSRVLKTCWLVCPTWSEFTVTSQRSSWAEAPRETKNKKSRANGLRMDSGDDFFPNVRGHFGLRLQSKRFNPHFLIDKGDFVGSSPKAGPLILQGVEHNTIQVFSLELLLGIFQAVFRFQGKAHQKLMDLDLPQGE